ncbi:MAG: DUF4157 domain-containing protein [Pseudomonadales bacterium]
MPQTAKVAQTVETAAPQSRVTDTVQENASSLEHAQLQAQMRGMNIPPNGSPASINHVVQRIAAGGQHPLQKHEDFMYLQRTIGNQAVVQLLDRMETAETEGIHKAAATGVQGAGSQLPHLDKIQQSFGQHDISGVQAFTGTKAATASKAIGAEAYTTGNKIAFSSPSPDLHTTAHETTHVLQQRVGVQLNGGVGKVGDSYERHADAVADKVVKGQSAEALINQQAGIKNTSPLQRKCDGGGDGQLQLYSAAEDFSIQDKASIVNPWMHAPMMEAFSGTTLSHVLVSDGDNMDDYIPIAQLCAVISVEWLKNDSLKWKNLGSEAQLSLAKTVISLDSLPKQLAYGESYLGHKSKAGSTLEEGDIKIGTRVLVYSDYHVGAFRWDPVKGLLFYNSNDGTEVKQNIDFLLDYTSSRIVVINT